jgi:spore germination protein PE
MKRISRVGQIKVTSTQFSSIVHIGDSCRVQPVSWILAVQKEVPRYWGNEGDFSKYGIYTQEIPKSQRKEELEMTTVNANPYIDVNTIYIIGISTAAVLQVGSTRDIETDSRVKHIRKLLTAAGR